MNLKKIQRHLVNNEEQVIFLYSIIAALSGLIKAINAMNAAWCNAMECNAVQCTAKGAVGWVREIPNTAHTAHTHVTALRE